MPAKIRKQFLPFAAVSFGAAETAAVIATLKSGWLSTGPKTLQFEKEFARFTGARHAIGLTSCTAALHLALLAHGIGKGDEVIVPSFTFAATANMVVNVGATPVFADILPDTYNLDPRDITKKITKRTKAIIPVHYAGQPANLDQVMAIARAHTLVVIEDAAHAVGATYAGKPIGSHGNTACFSFYATKNLTTGEGGMLTTNDDRIAEAVKKNRLHGISRDAWKRYQKGGSWRYEVTAPGWKYNMFDLQAALGLSQLKKLPAFLRRRADYAARYDRLFEASAGIRTPVVAPGLTHARHLYPILVDAKKRDYVIAQLARRNIGVSVHFIPLHLQPFYQKTFGYRKGDLPVTEAVFARILSLPLYPKMTKKDCEYVAAHVNDIINH